MKDLFPVLLSLTLSAPVLADQMIPDPESWYRDSYAVIWADAPWEQPEALMAHSADQVVIHSVDGGIDVVGNDWLLQPLQGWRDEGWLNSELSAIEVDRLNDTLATFKVRWQDNNVGDDIEFSCSWYQADFLDGAWKLTGYADIDCDTHGLVP